MTTRGREHALELIEKWNINILNIIFIGLSFLMVFFGILMSYMETKLPIAVKQFFRYGKHCYSGKQGKFMSLLEVPKGWFSHFYIFALIWSWWSMYLVVEVSLLHKGLPKYAEIFLDYIAGGNKNRKVLIDSTTCFITVALMCLQCSRRFYETNFVQIFSKKSKINLSHYFVGYLHYFGAILALLANTEGFVKGSTPSAINFSQISIIQYIAIVLFLFGWWHQYQSNIILVNLRKDFKTGKVATEKHLLPNGGFFEWVSSPHMLFEIAMYVILLWGFLAKSFTWWLVVIWVVSNQVYNAVCTQRWYTEAFNNYPKKRKAILPFIL